MWLFVFVQTKRIRPLFQMTGQARKSLCPFYKFHYYASLWCFVAAGCLAWALATWWCLITSLKIMGYKEAYYMLHLTTRVYGSCAGNSFVKATIVITRRPPLCTVSLVWKAQWGDQIVAFSQALSKWTGLRPCAPLEKATKNPCTNRAYNLGFWWSIQYPL